MKKPKAKPSGTSSSTDRDGAPTLEATEQKGDYPIRELWQNKTDSVHVIGVMNTGKNNHAVKTPVNFLQEAEREENRMYLVACLQRISNFSLFVALVDGFLGVEAKATLKRLASHLVTQLRQPYSKTCGYVKSIIAITLVHATHRCIRGFRALVLRISVQSPQCENGAGLNLFR